MKAAYDTVIVGSGFGGAVAAWRLAAAQRAAGRLVSVCVLERGKRYRRGEFPRDFTDPRSWFWRGGGRGGWTGLYDYRSFGDMGVLSGTGVGGTSLVYLDVQLDAFPSTFDFVGPEGRRRWPAEVDWARELKPYYDRLTEMLQPTPIPEPPLKTHALYGGAAGIGEDGRFELVPLAIYWGRDGCERGVLNPDPYGRGGPPQHGCAFCGECYIGCNIHAKNTLDLNYLWLAERAGAEVHSRRNVVAIERNGPDHPQHPGGYTVVYEDVRWRPFGGQVSARRLILAAGALGSTELLLRAKRGFRGGKRGAPALPALSDRLGSCFSGNGDFGAMATRTNRDTAPMVGPTITAKLNYADERVGHGFLIEDGGLPDILRAHLRRLPGELAIWRRVLRAIKDIGWGNADRRVVEGLFGWLDFETVRDSLPFLVMGHDAADGSMDLDDDGMLTLNWPHAASMDLWRGIEETVRRISEAPPPGFDGNSVFNPTWALKKQLITVHPLGGCPMGASPEEGVVDHVGRVFGYPELYVLDAAIVPSAVGANPSKTIGALAERVMDHLIRSDPDLAREPAPAPPRRPPARAGSS
jgi:cholesterol oxidase